LARELGDSEKIKEAEQAFADAKQRSSEVIASLQNKRAEKRTDIVNTRNKNFTEKGKARGNRYIDRMTTEKKAFGLIGTPRWQQEQANKLRGKPKKDKLRDELSEFALEELGYSKKDDPAPTTPPATDSSSEETTA
jgi:hypothetical protein